MEWFEKWFGEEYLLVYEHRNTAQAEADIRNIDKIIGFNENELVLDLCCGPGRHDNTIAQFGCRVIGLDYSMPLLKQASASVPSGMKYPVFVRGDARALPFKSGVFDIVLNLFTSFGYFEDTENHELLKSINGLLKPGGRFLIDYLNPPKVCSELVPETVREKDGMNIIEKRFHDTVCNRIIKDIIISKDGDSQKFEESVRLYTIEEMLGMIEKAGLKVMRVLGSNDCKPYNETSDRMIIYGIKEI